MHCRYQGLGHYTGGLGTTCAWLCLGSAPACRKASLLGAEATVTPKHQRVEQNFTKSLLYCIHNARFCTSICEWLNAILELTCGFKLCSPSKIWKLEKMDLRRPAWTWPSPLHIREPPVYKWLASCPMPGD